MGKLELVKEALIMNTILVRERMAHYRTENAQKPAAPHVVLSLNINIPSQRNLVAPN